MLILAHPRKCHRAAMLVERATILVHLTSPDRVGGYVNWRTTRLPQSNDQDGWAEAAQRGS